MASKINYTIPPQFFEFIRDRIAEILYDEFENQFMRTGDYELEIDVSTEGNFPQTNVTEIPLLDVSLLSGKYDGGQDYRGNVLPGLYQYIIDGFVNSKTPSTGGGDRLVAMKVQKIMGVARAILSDPIYKTLGIAPPSISRIFISDMNFSEPGKDDSLNGRVGRLILNVQVAENCQLPIPVMIAGYETRVFVNDTQRGYQYFGFNY